MTRLSSRRAFIATAVGGVAALAGCTGDGNDARNDAESGASDDGTDSTDASGDTDTGDGTADSDGNQDGTPANVDLDEIGLPVSEPVVPLSYELGGLEEDAVSGGVPKDGIPSIDEPSFDDVSGGDDMMDPGDPVFGVVLEGEARAYPQHILVHHEVVNDEINGRGVAVTYCPLTGTALGFDRGDVELGVSGRLVNSNLIMYDRETDSWWPQVVGTGVLGQLKGYSLNEFRVTWTTWERWKEVHPDTRVLNENTGHVRNYGNDPYGGYNPRDQYYEDNNVIFPPRFEDDSHDAKEVFIGARSADGAVAFKKDGLRDDQLLEATVGDVQYLAAYHQALDSAWVYRNPDEQSFTATDTGYQGPDGETYAADALPLESVNAFDAMWFAWYGFFPETVVVA